MPLVEKTSNIEALRGHALSQPLRAIPRQKGKHGAWHQTVIASFQPNGHRVLRHHQLENHTTGERRGEIVYVQVPMQWVSFCIGAIKHA